MNRRTIISLAGLLLLAVVMRQDDVFAQPQDVGISRIAPPSSFNPVGSGARALGMGGAFIAIADDATAASWNPGGLIQLGSPEISIVGYFLHRNEENEFGLHPEADTTAEISFANLNYLSLSYPFTLFQRNMVISANYQHLYDFHREFDVYLLQKETNLSVIRNFSSEQDGALSAIGLAYGIQVTPSISMGVTVNLWNNAFGANEWEEHSHEVGYGIHKSTQQMFQYESRYDNQYSLSGVNANLGLLWTLNDRWTIGAVLKMPFRAHRDNESVSSERFTYPDSPENDTSRTENSVTEEKLDMPLSFGIGVAYRFSDRLTVSADIYRTEWQDFILIDSEGNSISPVSGLSEDESDIDPTHQVRVGAEYLFFDPVSSKYIIPLRSGIFYDPSPAEGSPDDFYGFSAGTGIAYKNIVLDLSYQYRFGNDVRAYILESLKFSQNVSEHTVYASLIVHF